MRILDMRVAGIRCFEDTGDIPLHPKCNIFVGRNNAGKSTLLKAVLSLQLMPFSNADIRSGSTGPCFASIQLEDIKDQATSMGLPTPVCRVTTLFRGGLPGYADNQVSISPSQQLLLSNRPHHGIVPFLAKRKAIEFDHTVSTTAQASISGTLAQLYSRIDLLATYGHPHHEKFREAILRIVGLPITMRASPKGKEAGFYFDADNFVSLERMGDGVSEMVALIVELSTEEKRIFVLEEPETNLHPSGLKALLAMVRDASKRNQFIIATHSNIVVRELWGDNASTVFRVFRSDDSISSPSQVALVEHNPMAHRELLRELGYEFVDFELYEGWLFLEESSAESIIREILVPNFAPSLRGRLRTYAANGADDLEASISAFRQLVVFVHLQPVYEGRLWIRADGDLAGVAAIQKLLTQFKTLNEDTASSFSKEAFEHYYPSKFSAEIDQILAIKDKQERRSRKTELLQRVLQWTRDEGENAIEKWGESAEEVIEFLRSIEKRLAAT
ncbi:MAG: AAA family ATPase [Proteobacteria bacterium]|nr:AAA family ATPase [Pseudomonadota bacterium]